jgi:hypothetical protein
MFIPPNRWLALIGANSANNGQKISLRLQIKKIIHQHAEHLQLGNPRTF